MIIGLGNQKKPFLYLDEHCPEVDWVILHDEVSLGLAFCNWAKRYLAVGVHDKWANKEISTHIRLLNLTDHQKLLYARIDEFDTERKLKFFMCVTETPHPFWACYLRINKPKERTRMLNKAVGEDCEWTENIKYFPSLVDLIKKLPFESIGRVVIFMTESNNSLAPHFDSTLDNPNRPHDDFIWFTTSPGYKKIYVMDGETLERYHPDDTKKFLWFNEMDYHGTDPVPRFCFSIRIDGRFLPAVKESISS